MKSLLILNLKFSFVSNSLVTRARIYGAVIDEVRTFARRKKVRLWTGPSAAKAGGALTDSASRWKSGVRAETGFGIIRDRAAGHRGAHGVNAPAHAVQERSFAPGSAIIPVRPMEARPA